MEFGNDLLGALRDRMGMAQSRAVPAHPDWSGLHACCVATHAARSIMLQDWTQQAARRGSFGPDAARQLLTEYISSTDVNPTDLGDGKQLPGNAVGIPGAQAAGGRGL